MGRPPATGEECKASGSDSLTDPPTSQPTGHNEPAKSGWSLVSGVNNACSNQADIAMYDSNGQVRRFDITTVEQCGAACDNDARCKMMELGTDKQSQNKFCVLW